MKALPATNESSIMKKVSVSVSSKPKSLLRIAEENHKTLPASFRPTEPKTVFGDAQVIDADVVIHEEKPAQTTKAEIQSDVKRAILRFQVSKTPETALLQPKEKKSSVSRFQVSHVSEINHEDQTSAQNSTIIDATSSNAIANVNSSLIDGNNSISIRVDDDFAIPLMRPVSSFSYSLARN